MTEYSVSIKTTNGAWMAWVLALCDLILEDEADYSSGALADAVYCIVSVINRDGDIRGACLDQGDKWRLVEKNMREVADKISAQMPEVA